MLEREKSLLDDLVTMHHVYLLGLERGAKHAFRERSLDTRSALRRNIATLVELAAAVRGASADCTFEAFRREHVDDEGLHVAIAGCHAFERVEARGLLDAQLARHSTLKQYLPSSCGCRSRVAKEPSP